MMEEGNKRRGRPQVYDGQMSELAKKMQDKRRADREAEADGRQRVKADAQQTADNDERQTPEEYGRTGEGTIRWGVRGNTAPKSRRLTELLKGKRKREQENILKMRTLGIILGVLILLLVAALIYEVALGHGTKKTRNERVAEQRRVERALQESEEPAKEQETKAVDEEET